MTDRNCFMYLDNADNDIVFSDMESIFKHYGYQLHYNGNEQNMLIVFTDDGEENEVTRIQFKNMLHLKSSMSFNWRSLHTDSIISSSILFFHDVIYFAVDLSGSDQDEEILYCNIFINIAVHYAQKRQLIGFLVDTCSHYAEYNWFKFFLKDIYDKNNMSDQILMMDFLIDISKTDILGSYLPPLFALRLSLAHKLEATQHWTNMCIIEDVMIIYNPKTAFTFHEKPFSLDGLTLRLRNEED